MKTFLAIVVTLFLTLGAAVGSVWIARVPVAKTVCAAIKKVSQDECIKAVAVFLSDKSMCEGIAGSDFISNFNGKMVQLENPPKMQCLTDIAVRTNDVALCDGVEGFLISETKFSCQYSVAVRNKNAAACAALEGSESRLGMSQDKASCMTAIGKTEADVASAPPPKGPTPIFLGMGARAFDLLAYGLIGVWVLWVILGIVRAATRKKDKGDEEKPEEGKPAVK